MANNKVQLANGTVLIDLTDTTANASDVLSGEYFYNASGVKTEGSLTIPSTYTVTKTLTNVTTNNNDTEVLASDSFYMDLIPTLGYTINSIVITMGGIDITEQVFKAGVGEKIITQNGTYDAENDWLEGYSSVNVNVPNSYSVSDEGKVVSNGTLISQSSATYTSNATYDTTLIDSVTVNVSGGITPTGTKQISITSNGTTTEDVTNYASIEITTDVPTSIPENISVNIKNGKSSQIQLRYPTYNTTLGVVAANQVSRNAAATGTNSILKTGEYIGIGINSAVSSVTYNGSALEISTSGSSTSRYVKIKMPTNYDSSIPLIIT